MYRESILANGSLYSGRGSLYFSFLYRSFAEWYTVEEDMQGSASLPKCWLCPGRRGKLTRMRVGRHVLVCVVVRI